MVRAQVKNIAQKRNSPNRPICAPIKNIPGPEAQNSSNLQNVFIWCACFYLVRSPNLPICAPKKHWPLLGPAIWCARRTVNRESNSDALKKPSHNVDLATRFGDLRLARLRGGGESRLASPIRWTGGDWRRCSVTWPVQWTGDKERPAWTEWW